MQRRVEQSGLDAERLVRRRSDRLGNAVAVRRSPAQRLQDQHVERALQDVGARVERPAMEVDNLHPWL